MKSTKVQTLSADQISVGLYSANACEACTVLYMMPQCRTIYMYYTIIVVLSYIQSCTYNTNHNNYKHVRTYNHVDSSTLSHVYTVYTTNQLDCSCSKHHGITIYHLVDIASICVCVHVLEGNALFPHSVMYTCILCLKEGYTDQSLLRTSYEEARGENG